MAMNDCVGIRNNDALHSIEQSNVQKSSDAYRWEPLSPNSFRVLEIQEIQPDIKIQLHQHCLESPPSYHAISYAWGTDTPSQAIFCRNEKILVTQHLLDALKHVYSVCKKRFLWVDAININQNDEVEKAEQVRHMSRIFGNASDVVIWLGSDALGSDRAMKAIIDVKDNLPQLPKDINEALLNMKSHPYYNVFDISLFESLADLSDRGWFRRLWVAQEFVVGKDVSVLCGNQVLSAQDFAKVLGQVTLVGFGGVQPDTSTRNGDPFEGFKMLTKINRIKAATQSGHGLSFFDLVMFGRERDTYEPLDHIYALLGLAQDKDSIYHQNLVIDYSKANRQAYWKLYTEFSKIALMHEDHLKLFSFAASETKPDEMPSWCPNLNTLAQCAPYSEVYAAGWPYKVPADQQECPPGLGFSSCNLVHPHFRDKAKATIDFSNDNDSVTLAGAKIDSVAKVSHLFEWAPDFNTDNLYTARAFAESFLDWLDTCEEMVSGCYPHITEKEHIQAIWEDVFISNTDPKCEKKWPDGDEYEAPLAYKALKHILSKILKLEPEPADRSQDPELYRDFEHILAWIVVSQEHWTNRTFFVTENGRLGQGSRDTSIGDSVCMLYSGHPLYVLRSKSDNMGGRYSFVSDGYVYKMMNGETFEMMHRGELKEQRFCIS